MRHIFIKSFFCLSIVCPVLSVDKYINDYSNARHNLLDEKYHKMRQHIDSSHTFTDEMKQEYKNALDTIERDDRTGIYESSRKLKSLIESIPNLNIWLKNAEQLKTDSIAELKKQQASATSQYHTTEMTSLLAYQEKLAISELIIKLFYTSYIYNQLPVQ